MEVSGSKNVKDGKRMKHISPYTYLIMCIFILLVTACETEKMQQDDNYVRLNVDMAGSDPSNDLTADKLNYSICLFEADKVLSGPVPDNEAYVLKEIHVNISRQELAELYYSFDNYKLEEKLFRLLIFSTPEEAECEIIAISGGLETEKTKYSDIRLSMIKVGNAYVPLSRNNFYAIRDFSGWDIKNGKIINIEVSLTRAVGQLVFDIFKIDGSLDRPIGIDTEIEGVTMHASVIDRIKKIEMEVVNPTQYFNPSDSTAVVDDATLLQYDIIPVLEDGSYFVTIADQKDTELIEIPEKNLKGSVRVFGPYLMSSDITRRGEILVNLTFSYYDTTPVYSTENGGASFTYNENKLSLSLPSGNSPELKIAQNYYTVTRIGIKCNRIIDISTSSDLSFGTGWNN